MVHKSWKNILNPNISNPVMPKHPSGVLLEEVHLNLVLCDHLTKS
jgi:hypothetical protein